MSPVPILIDPKLLYYDLEDINGSKGKRIGFFQENEFYVFTTEALYPQKSLITNITKIAELLKRAYVNPIDFKYISFQHTIKNLDYLKKISDIIDKHNAIVTKIKDNFLVKFLSRISVIKSIVNWIFYHLSHSWPVWQDCLLDGVKKGLNLSETHEEWINKFRYIFQSLNSKKSLEEEIQKFKLLHRIRDMQSGKKEAFQELLQSPTITELQQSKNQLLDLVFNTRSSYLALNIEPSVIIQNNMWNEASTNVIKEFDHRLKELTPALQQAETVIKMELDGWEKIASEAFSLSNTNSLIKSKSNYEKTLQILDVSSDVAIHLTDHLNYQIKKAKNILQDSYKKWLLDQMSSMNSNPSTLERYFQENDKEIIHFLWQVQSLFKDDKITISGIESARVTANHFYDKWQTPFKKVEKLIHEANKNPNKLYGCISGLKEATSIEQGNQCCITFLSEIAGLDTEDQAKNLIVKAYKQWFEQYIIAMMSLPPDRSLTISQLFGSSNFPQFITIFQQIKFLIGETGNTENYTLTRLIDFCETQLKSSIQCLYTSDDCRTLKPISELFKEDLSLEELMSQKEHYLTSIDEWNTFQELKVSIGNCHTKNLLSLKKEIENGFQEHLEKLVPAYKLVRHILNYFPSQEAANGGRAWYENNLEVLENEKKRLAAFKHLQIIVDAIEMAIQELKKRYSQLFRERDQSFELNTPETSSAWISRVFLWNQSH